MRAEPESIISSSCRVKHAQKKVIIANNEDSTRPDRRWASFVYEIKQVQKQLCGCGPLAVDLSGDPSAKLEGSDGGPAQQALSGSE